MTAERKCDIGSIDVDDILDGAARALFLSAYANAVDDAEEHPDDYPEGFADRGAGPGEDWDDVAPETPPEARDSARRLLDRMGGDDNVSRLCAAWMEAGGSDGGSAYFDSAEERFGHCLAMQAIGSGVGCEDDVRPDADYNAPRTPYWDAHFDGERFFDTVGSYVPPRGKGKL